MGEVGPGGRAVEPETAPEPPWRALLESRSLPKGVNHSRRSRMGTPLSAIKRWPPPAGRLRRSTGFAYSSPSKPTPTDS